MTDKRHPLFTFCLSGAGRNEEVRPHLAVFAEVEEGVFERVISHEATFKMDGGEYDPAEWVRELLTAIVESL